MRRVLLALLVLALFPATAAAGPVVVGQGRLRAGAGALRPRELRALRPRLGQARADPRARVPGRRGRLLARRPGDRPPRQGPAGVGLRPALAGVRGPHGLRDRRPGPRLRLLPEGRGGRWEDVRARRRRVGALRPRVGAEARAGGPAPGRQAGAPRRARGDPRRPLAGRVDGGRLRGVGLRRPRRPPRPLRPRADRRRPARQLHHAAARGRQAAPRRAADRRPVRRPARRAACRGRRAC